AEQAGIGYQRYDERLVTAYARLMRSPDLAVRTAAADAWADWEDTHVSIGAGGFHRDPRWDDPTFAAVFATLVTHYWSSDGFLEPPILDRVSEIAHLPAVLIHGRLDVSGPVVTAWRLAQAWPGSELVIDEGEGHGGLSRVAEWGAAHRLLARQ